MQSITQMRRLAGLARQRTHFIQIVKDQNSLHSQMSEDCGDAHSLPPHSSRIDFAGIELVELIGIEPTTPCLQSRCSPS